MLAELGGLLGVSSKSVIRRADLGSWRALLPKRRYQFRGSIVVSISARHAEDPGSIPGRGDF